MKDVNATIAVFDDERNVTVGRGRIIWARATRPTVGPAVPEGWALPGGRRTTDKEEARAAASWIDNNHFQRS